MTSTLQMITRKIIPLYKDWLKTKHQNIQGAQHSEQEGSVILMKGHQKTLINVHIFAPTLTLGL